MLHPPHLRFSTLAACLLCSVGFSATAATLSVGPGKTYTTPCQAFGKAADGDTIEIAGGTTYSGDVCGIYANNLTIRGVNGRPKIDAAGKYSMGKGIWVVVGKNTTIDNVEMYGAKVPDRNGAAIRLDGMHLTMRNSHLHHNENGILTNNDGVTNIVIENTEFGFNGYGDGYSHNLYVGKVASLVFRASFSHDANVGHNLKSRAKLNVITDSRFSSTTGKPSYEIDLPNAGTAYIVGNVIQQPADNNNPGLGTFGVEGATNGSQELYVVNNTFINERSSGGTFLFVGSGVTTPIVTRNNLAIGTGTFSTQGSTIDHNNLKVASFPFVDRANYDLRPTPTSQATDTGVDPGVAADGTALAPKKEYLPDARSRDRVVVGKIDIGAYESTSGPVTVAAPSSGSPTTPVVPPQESSWVQCARENATCGVPGVRTVRYGANGKYIYKTVTAQVACTNAVFGDPIKGVAKTCEYDNSAPRTWSMCAPENGVCSVSGTKQVRYGAQNKYSYNTVTGQIACTNAKFGDPIVGVAKTCEVSSN